MGFIGVILLPVFSAPGTIFAASLFAIPFLIGFGIDWLYVSGVLKPADRSLQINHLHQWGLPTLRLIAAGLAGMIFVGRLSPAATELPAAYLILELAVAILVLLGSAGRIFALAGLILIGLSQQFAGLTPAQFLLVAIYTALLFGGTGALSLWMPEDRVLFNHLGKPRPKAILEQGQ